MLSIATSAVVVLLLQSALVVSGCRLQGPYNATAALLKEHYVFRGMVEQEKSDYGAASDYLVKVSKVFKGCNFVASDRVIVSTFDDQCDRELQVNRTYLFSASWDGLYDGLVITWSTEYNYNIKWSAIKSADLKVLRAYNNSNCAPNCGLGEHCPAGHYCYDHVCTSFTPKCPTPLKKCDGKLGSCSRAPLCMVPSSDFEISYDPEEATCYDDFCGGCKHFFVDNLGNRVRKCNY